MEGPNQLSTSKSVHVLRLRSKFIKIKMIRKQKMLCAVDLQDAEKNAPLAHIETDEQNKRALMFFYRGNRYWVTAKEKKLHFAKDGEKGYEKIWFEKQEMGTSEISGLRFVNEKTTWYLSATRPKDRTQVLTFTDKPIECVPITFESRNGP